MKRVLLSAALLLTLGGCRVYYPHYLVYTADYRNRVITMERIPTPDTTQLETFYPLIRAKFDTLMVGSGGNLDFYIEFKKWDNSKTGLAIFAGQAKSK